MNPIRYLHTVLGCHAARLRSAVRANDKGASAIELAIITAVLVALAAAILVIIVNFANSQSSKITQTTVPAP